MTTPTDPIRTEAPEPMRLSGLEPVTIGDDALFVNIADNVSIDVVILGVFRI